MNDGYTILTHAITHVINQVKSAEFTDVPRDDQITLTILFDLKSLIAVEKRIQAYRNRDFSSIK
jgi:hypothetical protein